MPLFIWDCRIVDVVANAKRAQKDVADQATVDNAGVPSISLETLALAALTADQAAGLTYGFVADDGFTPTDKGLDPLDWTTLKQGFIDPATRDLAWPEALGLSSKWSVKTAATLLVFGEPVVSGQ